MSPRHTAARANGVMAIPEKAVLVAFQGQGDFVVPQRTSLCCEIGELEKRVRAVDHLSSLARLALVGDFGDDENDETTALAREEPCLARARELVGVSNHLASLETAELAWEGVMAASRAAAASATNEHALRDAAETAHRLELALRRLWRDDVSEGRGNSRWMGDAGDTRTSPSTAQDALHAAVRALRAAAGTRDVSEISEIERNAGKTQLCLEKDKNNSIPTKHKTSSSSLTQKITPWLARASGRWSKAHCGMVIEFRGKNPFRGDLRKRGDGGKEIDADTNGDDDQISVDAFFPSAWAKRFRRACRVIEKNAREGIRIMNDTDDTEAPTPCSGFANPKECSGFAKPKQNHADGFMCVTSGDFFTRTAFCAANWTAHQILLYPKSRTLADLVRLVGDCDFVLGAMLELEEVFDGMTTGTTDEEKSNAISSIRQAISLFQKSRTAVTDGIVAVVGTAVSDVYASSGVPPGNWNNKKQRSGAGWRKESLGVTENASPPTIAIRDEIVGPLFKRVSRLSRNSAACLIDGLGVCLVKKLLTRVLLEGPGGVKRTNGGAHRLSGDLQVFLDVVESAAAAVSERAKKNHEANETDFSNDGNAPDTASRRHNWQLVAQTAKTVVLFATTVGDVSVRNSTRVEIWESLVKACGAGDAEKWKTVCV